MKRSHAKPQYRTENIGGYDCLVWDTVEDTEKVHESKASAGDRLEKESHNQKTLLRQNLKLVNLPASSGRASTSARSGL